MKKMIHTALTIATVVGLIALMAFSAQVHSKRSCPGVTINIDYGQRKNASDILLVFNDVKQALSLNFDSLKGKPLSEINIEEIEKVISNMSYVKSVEAYAEIDGQIQLLLTQRRPIARVYGTSGKSFYIDQTGTIIPIRTSYPARVVVISGYIDDAFYTGENLDIMASKNDSLFANSPLRMLYKLAAKINNDDFLKDEITQININSDQSIDLIPLVGNHVIQMLSLNNYDEKLEKLKLFYKEGLKQSGWGKYKKINIEYKDQIVCTKI